MTIIFTFLLENQTEIHLTPVHYNILIKNVFTINSLKIPIYCS